VSKILSHAEKLSNDISRPDPQFFSKMGKGCIAITMQLCNNVPVSTLTYQPEAILQVFVGSPTAILASCEPDLMYFIPTVSVPATSNLLPGFVVPMPTLPVLEV
jgi:hypothetical protein